MEDKDVKDLKDTVDTFDTDVDSEEYEKALAVLNSSKGARVRDINERKKAEKKAAVSSDWSSKSFIDKCKADIVIPICIAALALIAVAAVIFIVVPAFKDDSKSDLGLTYAELRTRYSATDMYIQCSLGDYGFEIPETTTPVSQDPSEESVNDSSIVESASFSSLREKTNLDAWVVCMSDKQGGKLSEIDACIVFDESNPYINSWIMFYFVSYLQVFDPSITSESAMESISNAVANLGQYHPIGEYSYSINLINSPATYYCLQIVPSDLADDYVEARTASAA